MVVPGETIPYGYDAMGRLTSTTGNLRTFFGASPLEYLYDNAGRLVTMQFPNVNEPGEFTKYIYQYDNSNFLTKIVDWDEFQTKYTYNNISQMSNLEFLHGTSHAKDWDFAYTPSGQLDLVTPPNGLLTDYVYDSDGILSQIKHESGGWFPEHYTYAYDDLYNITSIGQVADLTNWHYRYDSRNRLTSAVRHHLWNTVNATSEYTYDAGDNLITKKEPWNDDFSDRDLGDGWTSTAAPNHWSASTGRAISTPASTGAYMSVPNTDPDIEFEFTYALNTSNQNAALVAYPRDIDGNNRVVVIFTLLYTRIQEKAGGVTNTIHTAPNSGSVQGNEYTVRISAKGDRINVLRRPAEGGKWTFVLDQPTTILTANKFAFSNTFPGSYMVDDVTLHSDVANMKRTTTYTVGSHNQLASSTSEHEGSIAYAYDGWGRLSTETQAGVTKTYDWTWLHQLAGVDSSDPNDSDVDNLYFAETMNRVLRFEGGALRQSYAHDGGMGEVNETYWTGPSTNIKKVYVPGLAEVDVTTLVDSDPNNDSATYRYITTDHLGSTRSMYDQSKQLVGRWEYTPYGEPYNFGGPPDVTQLYTGHTWDPIAKLYYAPYRMYDPQTARWLAREPLGMLDGPNMYGYVGGNPITFMDPNGLWGVKVGGINIGVGDPTFDFDGADWGGYGGDVGNTLIGELKGAASELSFGLYSPCYASASQSQGGYVGVGLAMLGGILLSGGTGAVKGAHTVYEGVDKASGVVRYVGRTARGVATRGAENEAAGGGKQFLTYQAVRGGENLTLQAARVMEQRLINQYGLGKNGGQLLNKINSISPKYWAQHGIVP
jgi:RHS repeat-associated protein